MSVPAMAADFGSGKYEVYWGDTAQDGYSEVYLHGKDRFVLIHGEIVTPILIDPHPSYTFDAVPVDYGTCYPEIMTCPYPSTRTFSGNPTLVSPRYTNQEMIDSDLTMLVENSEYYWGDFDGNGTMDLLVVIAAENKITLISGGSNQEDAPHAYEMGISEELITQSIITNPSLFSVRDANNDGRDELVARVGSGFADKLFNFSFSSGQSLAYTVDYDTYTPVSPQSSSFAASMVGEFRVSESGAATYNVPIKLPEGIAGVAPEVSLSYSSQSGNGIAGLGWSLNAGSAIKRCRQTLFDDGQAKALNLSSADRFCLDGQKLVLLDENKAYGDPDTRYKTQLDSFTLVIAKGGVSGAGNPAYFEVIAKDGSKRTYGSSANHRETVVKENHGDLEHYNIAWHLSKFTDNVGNSVRYDYVGEGGDLRLSGIEYAEATAGDIRSQVIFNYEDRPDISGGYLLGQKFSTTQRLSRIDVYNNANQALSSGTPSSSDLLRSYSLLYKKAVPSDKISRLVAIQECVKINSNCLPALSFAWNIEDISIGDTPAFESELISWDYTERCTSYRPGRESCTTRPVGKTIFHDFKAADINGDGCSELVYSYFDEGYNTYYVSYLMANESCTGLQPLETASEFAFSVTSGSRFQVVDFNADGRSDIAVYLGGRWDILLSEMNLEGDWQIVNSGDPYMAHIDGDVLVDVDSDGLFDVVNEHDERIYVSKLKRAQSLEDTDQAPYRLLPAERLQGQVDIPYVKPCSQQIQNIRDVSLIGGGFAGDFDGDGKVDLAVHSYHYRKCGYRKPIEESNKALYLYSVADGALNKIYQYTGVHKDTAIIVDINNDGFSDLVFRDPEGGHVILSTGVGFKEVSTLPFSYSGSNVPMAVDYNRDGYIDLVYHNKSDNTLELYTWNNEGEEFTGGTVIETGLHDKDATVFTDFNGNGINDKLRLTGAYDKDYNNKQFRIFNDNSSSNIHNVITEIDNNFGNKTLLTYERQSLSEHYTGLHEHINGTKQNCIDIGDIDFSQISPKPTAPGASSTDENVNNYQKFEYLYCETVANTDEFYRRIHNPWGLSPSDPEFGRPVFEYRSPMPIVTAVESTSPSTDSTSDGDLAKISYYYKEGRIQAGGRGFLGFDSLTTIAEQSAILTRTQYAQQYPFTGMPILTESYSRNNVLLSRSENTFDDSSPDGAQYYQPYVSETVEEKYSENSGAVKQSPLLTTATVEKTQDVHGNVTWTKTEIDSSFEVDGNPETLNTIQESTNLYGDASDTLTLHSVNFTYAELGRLTATTVTGSRDGAVTNSKTSNFEYYDQTQILNEQNTSVYGHVGMLKSETVEPEDASEEQEQRLRTTYYYDSKGNQKLIATAGWDGLNTVTRYVVNNYDTSGRYLNSTTNALGQTLKVVTERDDLYGTPLRVETIHGQVITTGIDALGRVISTESNLGTNVRETTEYLPCSQLTYPSCPSYAQYATRMTKSSGNQSIKYFDALGREIRSAQINFHGDWVFNDTEYDLLGRVAAKSEPYIYPTNANQTIYWTRTYYDDFGRPTYIDAPGENEADISYHNLSSTTVNALGQSKTEWKNAAGELLMVEDEMGSTIRYLYDAESNLERIRVSDDSGTTIETVIEHDFLGRKISMDDLDKGVWLYEYNAFGELIEQQDAKGQVVVNEYDILGRVTTRIDYRDSAKSQVEGVTYNYYDGKTDLNNIAIDNAIGQTSAVIYAVAPISGQNKCADSAATYCSYAQFDSFGRAESTTLHVDADGDLATPKEIFDSSLSYHSEFGWVEYQYDALNGKIFDENGDPIVSGTRDSYNAYGYLEVTHDLASDTEIYRTVNVNARGQVEDAFVGNIGRHVDYYEATGLIQKQIAYNGVLVETMDDQPSAFNVQYITYEWDFVGNLLSRHNQSAQANGSGVNNLEEMFCYDRLNRLVASVPGNAANCGALTPEQEDQRYNAFGNMTYKRDENGFLSAYEYGQINNGPYTAAGQNYAGPHAVSFAQGVYYRYDQNGNMVEDSSGRQFSYSTYDKPIQITNGTHTSRFAYGPDRSRYVQVETNTQTSAKNKTTLYLGGIERIYRDDEDLYEWKRHVKGAIHSYTTAKVGTQFVQNSAEIVHILKDHLGSTDVLLDADGNILENMSFDPWGARRNIDWTQMSIAQQLQFESNYSARGFTSHEMLDEFGIIHMNGRIYDAKLGRFLQADPFIQAAKDTQMYNRYSYMRNNPLNGTDPSGYFASFFVAVVVGYMIGAVGRAIDSPFLQVVGSLVSCVGGDAVTCAAGTFGATYGYTQDFGAALKAGVLAGISAGAFKAVGAKFAGMQNANQLNHIYKGVKLYKFGGLMLTSGQIAAQIASHAMIGGVMSVMQGGKFGHGFASAGLSKTFMGGAGFKTGDLSLGETVSQTAVAGLIGGTVSEVTGGKFANGAATAALGHLFNQVNSSKETNLSKAYKGWRETAKLLSENPWKAMEQMSTKEYIAFKKLEFDIDLSGTNENIVEALKAQDMEHIRAGLYAKQLGNIGKIINGLGNEAAESVLTGYTLKLMQASGLYNVSKYYEWYETGKGAIDKYNTARDIIEYETTD